MNAKILTLNINGGYLNGVVAKILTLNSEDRYDLQYEELK